MTEKLIDLENIKEKLAKTYSKYKGNLEEYLNSRVYDQIGHGVEAIERIKSLTEEVSSQVEEGNLAVQGIVSLMRKENGKELNKGQKDSLEKLRKVYEGNSGIFHRLYYTLVRNKYPSLKDALKIVENIAEKIPPYISYISKDLNLRGEELTNLRSGLRKNIETLIESKPSLEKDIIELNNTYGELKKEYNSLEAQRAKNSSEGKASDIDSIVKLEKLESILSEIKEKSIEIETKKETLQSDINVMNNQVGKVGQLTNLLEDAQKTVHLAKRFVDVQIPYVIGEVRTQRSEINSLFGVKRSLDFLEKQADASGRLNNKIKESLIYLDDKVVEIRTNLSSKESIYYDSKRIIEIENSYKKPVKELTH